MVTRTANRIVSDVEIVDLCIVIGKTLVISDIHLGYEEALNKQGILIPRIQYAEAKKRIAKIIKKRNVDTIVINGDLKHKFGSIMSTEWRYVTDLISFLSEYGRKVILIRGNHDKIIAPLIKSEGVEIRDYYTTGRFYICHGNTIPKDKDFKHAECIIIGHEHPAIALKDGNRIEVYRCFLIGKWKDKQLIVMPSFNLTVKGTSILKKQLLSPFLKQDLGRFRAIITDKGKLYDFGFLKDIATN